MDGISKHHTTCVDYQIHIVDEEKQTKIAREYQICQWLERYQKVVQSLQISLVRNYRQTVSVYQNCGDQNRELQSKKWSERYFSNAS